MPSICTATPSFPLQRHTIGWQAKTTSFFARSETVDQLDIGSGVGLEIYRLDPWSLFVSLTAC